MIICPNCGGKNTTAPQARNRPKAPYVWRSRTCKDCGKTFSTREYTLEELANLMEKDSETVVNLRSQCDDLLADLALLISQYQDDKRS
jgi:transcriptional regulator NrdR family protein|tara:strand:- start:58 stop:321 length:264 start_codon:yes stop_codon:yes gene_type:complete